MEPSLTIHLAGSPRPVTHSEKIGAVEEHDGIGGRFAGCAGELKVPGVTPLGGGRFRSWTAHG